MIGKTKKTFRVFDHELSKTIFNVLNKSPYFYFQNGKNTKTND